MYVLYAVQWVCMCVYQMCDIVWIRSEPSKINDFRMRVFLINLMQHNKALSGGESEHQLSKPMTDEKVEKNLLHDSWMTVVAINLIRNIWWTTKQICSYSYIQANFFLCYSSLDNAHIKCREYCLITNFVTYLQHITSWETYIPIGLDFGYECWTSISSIRAMICESTDWLSALICWDKVVNREKLQKCWSNTILSIYYSYRCLHKMYIQMFSYNIYKLYAVCTMMHFAIHCMINACKFSYVSVLQDARLSFL